MADSLKRKRLDKASDDTLSFNSSSNVYCHRCGRAFSRRKGYFPVSHSPMYRGVGNLPWCNDCIDEMYEEYRSKLGDKDAMRRMCMKLDLYWNESIYNMVERQAGVNSRVRTYIGKSNIVRFIDKTFDDTLLEESNSEARQPDTELVANINKYEGGIEDEQVEQAVIDFWGSGYTYDFYEALEKRYREWTGNANIVDPSERSLYRQICLLEVIINRDAAEGKPVKDNVNALNTLLGSMNLKPSQQKTDADTELDKMPLGVGIDKWEYYRPLPPTETNKKDINGLVRNISTWFLGHAGKMVNLRNSYVQMYEDAMAELRVKHPEFEDEDDDTMLTDIFGNTKVGGVDG